MTQVGKPPLHEVPAGIEDDGKLRIWRPSDKAQPLDLDRPISEMPHCAAQVFEETGLELQSLLFAPRISHGESQTQASGSRNPGHSMVVLGSFESLTPLRNGPEEHRDQDDPNDGTDAIAGSHRRPADC